MRRRAFPVEQPGSRQNIGAGTDGRQATNGPGTGPDKSSQRRTFGCGATSIAPGYDQGINVAGSAQAQRRQADTGGTAHRPSLRTDDPQRIAARAIAFGDLKCRNGSGDIEQLKVRIDQEVDSSAHGRNRWNIVIYASTVVDQTDAVKFQEIRHDD